MRHFSFALCNVGHLCSINKTHKVGLYSRDELRANVRCRWKCWAILQVVWDFELSNGSCSNDNLVEQMCKKLLPTKTRRGNCLVLPHTGYALGHRAQIRCPGGCPGVPLVLIAPRPSWRSTWCDTGCPGVPARFSETPSALLRERISNETAPAVKML